MKPTCENCTSHDRELGCLNGITWIGRPADACDQHETPAKFEADRVAIVKFRQAIGLPPTSGGTLHWT